MKKIPAHFLNWVYKFNVNWTFYHYQALLIMYYIFWPQTAV